MYQFILPHLPPPLFSGLTSVPFPSVGTSPNVARNAIVNCAELVTYDLIKDALLKANLMTGERINGAESHPSCNLGADVGVCCLRTTSFHPTSPLLVE